MPFHFYLVHNPVCFELKFFNKQNVLQRCSLSSILTNILLCDKSFIKEEHKRIIGQYHYGD